MTVKANPKTMTERSTVTSKLPSRAAMPAILDRIGPERFGQGAQRKRRRVARPVARLGVSAALDVWAHGVVLGYAPVRLGNGKDLHDVPVGVVVCEERSVPVSGSATVL
jgi:hypothetical protein